MFRALNSFYKKCLISWPCDLAIAYILIGNFLHAPYFDHDFLHAQYFDHEFYIRRILIFNFFVRRILIVVFYEMHIAFYKVVAKNNLSMFWSFLTNPWTIFTHLCNIGFNMLSVDVIVCYHFLEKSFIKNTIFQIKTITILVLLISCILFTHLTSMYLNIVLLREQLFNLFTKKDTQKDYWLNLIYLSEKRILIWIMEISSCGSNLT